MHRILNAHSGSKLTDEYLNALVSLHPSTLARLDENAAQHGARCIVRRDYATAVQQAHKVAVISGGGGGHEPAHAGLVGAGLLTAAVCGDIFASPSSAAVLAAIVTVSSVEAGCLLVVKNYTGDRLNFGIAAQLARSRFNIRCETVYVADDIALEEAAQPRGLAGTIFVHKAAGALAEAGATLADVAEAARKVASSSFTMNVAYNICCLPDFTNRPNRLAIGTVEIGLGIHGEPGTQISAPSASDLAEMLVGRVLKSLAAVAPQGPIALLVNNLGSTTPIELAVFGAACREACERKGFSVKRLFVGTLMTSLDMHGVSVSVLDLTAFKCLTLLLDTPCASVGLQSGAFIDVSKEPLRIAVDPKCFDDAPLEDLPGDIFDGMRFGAALKVACDTVVSNEPELTKMDTKVGDGDCGTTLKQGALALLADFEQRPCEYEKGASRALAAVGHALGKSMGGSSGVLYTLGARAAEAQLRRRAADGNSDADAAWKAAFVAFAHAISSCGGAGIGSRTMCDATLPAAEVFKRGGSLAEAAEAARAGVEFTKSLVATHGRSAYVSADAQRGVADPGAYAIAAIFRALADAGQAP
ncbi:hypothetical protein M885DRAFT_532036 [Pelagophyceae sp. CCMP2097]|nr:hypothetical protein M885DRAFT_532036 [Pelagophyceae sp. CCMP2097]|mmetsp:Transcript_28144/g.94792  ORF Transcript_28144/g.94792 Transcript_28144/m.94792 type:complete len:586 (+) Transcript_28144:149-1906(+)